MQPTPAQPDDWEFLRTYTLARIAPGRAGHSLPTKALLDFNLDHARARDAVHSALDVERFSEKLRVLYPEILCLKSKAKTRQEYLLRPDFGRTLSEESRENLQTFDSPGYTLGIVVADGLSAQAVENHAVPLLEKLVPACREWGWNLAPLCLVEQGRVAVADEIGALLKVELVVILLGERPGLSSPDSLGAYLTYAPRPGLSDEARNCVSNIRTEGM
ncbi:MAG: ethanolamine ammonia-lyase subunit EutC, partial [Sphingobacteriaceae bacterium]|nr:ethanolamine ammonia-lyase subunit EutC [Cytophagaceae bacterium]